MTIAEEIRSSLVANIDEGYRDFHAKLVPTIDPARILGVPVAGAARRRESVQKGCAAAGISRDDGARLCGGDQRARIPRRRRSWTPRRAWRRSTISCR